MTTQREAMSRFIRLQRSAYMTLESQIFVPGMRSCTATSGSYSCFCTYGSAAGLKSPMEANLLRILRNQIQNHTEYAPFYQPATEIGVFKVTIKPWEQLIELNGKYGGNEDIRIQTSTFDWCKIVPLTGEGPSRAEECHHLSLHIQISKGHVSSPLEVICSSWPEFLEVHRFFVDIDQQRQMVKPYIGRYFGALDTRFRSSFYKFLGERGIDNELSFLLHRYVKNMKKMDSVRWLSKVQSFVDL